MAHAEIILGCHLLAVFENLGDSFYLVFFGLLLVYQSYLIDFLLIY